MCLLADLSGEDPVLGAQLGPPLVAGIQKHVMAIAKHYVLNNQETDRSGGNMIADEKTMMELYAPPFEAVAPTVAGYMCSCEHPHPVATTPRTTLPHWPRVRALAALVDNRAHAFVCRRRRRRRCVQRQPGQRDLCMRKPNDAADDAQGTFQFLRVRRIRLVR